MRPLPAAARSPRLPVQVARSTPLFQFSPDGGPVVVGHRGMGEGARENTLESFMEAAVRGASWIETDVQRTCDGTLFLHHDLRLPDGRALADLTTPEAHHAGLLRLDELHGALPRGVGINLEVKGSLRDLDADSTFEQATSWAHQRLAERPLLVTSFCPSVAGAQAVPMGVLSDVGWQYHLAVLTAVRLGAAVVATHASVVLDLDPDQPALVEILEVLDRRGLSVLTWGSQTADIPTLLERGVTALCTDDVPGAVEALRARQPAVERLIL